MMKRWIPVIALLVVAALSPAPINDKRSFVRQPELSDAEREKHMQGVRMGNIGTVPEDTERTVAPSITGDSDASRTIRNAGDPNETSGSSKGAAAVKEASRELAQKGKPNFGRIFAGALIVFAAFGLFQVFRMWANKALPDAPTSYK